MTQKMLSEWEKEKAQQAAEKAGRGPRVYSATSVFSTLDSVFAAVVANEIEAKNLRNCLATVRRALDPAFRCDFGDDATMARSRAAMDVWVAALAGTGELKLATTKETAEPEVKVTAADFARASAIAAGKIVELPNDPVARAIIGARNERKDFL